MPTTTPSSPSTSTAIPSTLFLNSQSLPRMLRVLSLPSAAHTPHRASTPRPLMLLLLFVLSIQLIAHVLHIILV